MRKLLSILMIVLLLTSLVGCSTKEEVNTDETKDDTTSTSGSESEDSNEDTDVSVEKTKITLGFQADSVGGFQKVIAEFLVAYPQYEVEYANMTNDSAQMHDQLLTSLSSGSDEYDVITMDVVWAGEFAAAGFLEPVDELLMDEGWKVSDFNAGSMASGKYQGKNYVLPYFPDLGFLYYRSDIVSEEDTAKLVTGDYTWDDLYAMAEKYVGEADTKYGIVYQSKQYEGLVCNLNEFSSNWSDISGGLEMMKAFTESAATPEDILTYTEGETHTAFTNKEAVFARNWPYMYGMAKSEDTPITLDEVGLAPLPTGGTVGGWLIGLNKKSDNLEGAKDFMKFLAGEQGQKIMVTTNGSLPGLNTLLTNEEAIAANALLSSDAFKIALSNTIARPVVANYSEVSDIIQVAAHSYLSGSKSLEEATQEIKSALEQ